MCSKKVPKSKCSNRERHHSIGEVSRHLV
uniref:Uncharacterized protein n=1 Tax=Rhizophora mucronata TaxID=61149 RepID=A0A2P2KHU6_RHIMU